MINELLKGSSAHPISKKEENLDVRDASPQNITVVFPASKEEVSIDSIVLLTSYHSDNLTMDSDGQHNSAAIPILVAPIIDGNSKTFFSLRKRLVTVTEILTNSISGVVK
ncbi:hypothetical protein FXV91_00470 [Methanosarcina sp. DH2]|uniref:hypothetical protein n=1 Tax=Methanosarcina sp. DH2 TaxID=2605639 RepID=UPI001E450323|nr:hypothetical protein [Methanosarcina sp. DH2]MCC4768720.1 hypothetical protein [Methanosarcina sp. DH2]